MKIYFILNLFASFIILSLGFFVFIKNRKSTLNRVFNLFTLASFIWLFNYGLSYLFRDENSAFFFLKIGYAGVTLIPITIYHFTILFLNLIDNKIEKILVRMFYIIGAIYVVLLFNSDYFIAGTLYKYFWGYYPRASILHPFYILFLVSIVIKVLLSFYLSLKRHSTLLEYQRIKSLFIAFIFFTLSACDFIQNYGIEFYPFGWIFVMLFAFITAYTIVRYQLLEIEVIIKKTLIFAGLFAGVFAVLVLPTLMIQEFIIRKMGFGARLIGFGVSTILIVLILRPLENFLIKITDKFLFQKRYDYKELLKTFTGEVLTVLDLTRLVRLTTYKLADIIKLISCGILLFDDKEDGYKLIASYGIKEKNIVLTREDTLASFMERTRTYLSTRHTEKDYAIPEDIIKDMNRLKVELAIPLILHDDMIGILTLGKKKSDEPYNQDDMDILLPLARTLAIAITNAKLFDEAAQKERERLLLEMELQRSERLKTVSTLAAGMAHEIKNPLTSIKTFVEYIDEKYQDPGFRAKFKNIVPKEVDKIANIIDQLLDYSKVDRVNLKTTDIHRILDYAIDLYNNEFLKKHIKLIKSYNALHPLIECDENQMKQAFINIVLNSIEAMPNGGELAIKTGDINNALEISIQDTGSGITKDKLERLFDPFYTTKEKGTGLGLFIVHQILQNNKGRIAIDSEVNKGTTVKVIFEKEAG